MPTGGAFGLPGFDPTFQPAGLSSTSLTPNWTATLPSGGGGTDWSAVGGGKDWGGAAGAIAPLLVSLFGNNQFKDKASGSADSLSKMAAALSSQGGSLSGKGSDALAPVMKYLMAVAGGDPTALLNATAPERARVIDQYDTARRSIQFAPRGGGQATAATNLEAKKASDLGVLTSTARREGVSQLGDLGKGLLSAGAQEQESGAQAQSAATAAFQKQSDQQDAQLASFGKAIGTALPLILAAL